jgi:hypothetical protein
MNLLIKLEEHADDTGDVLSDIGRRYGSGGG